MQTVTLARHAMATRFEIVLHGDNPVALRAAGEAALDEIDRLEAMLSLYHSTSEVARLNALAAREAVRVSPELFRLLEHAGRLSAETGGVFDITIAPLMRCWGFIGGTGQMPTPEAIAEARAKVGTHLLQLAPEDRTVRFACAGVMLDFGAIGKGYAIERAAEVLREAGVTNALIHGGTSTVQAFGQPADGGGWKVAVERPPMDDDASHQHDATPELLAVVTLNDEALSVSAVWGKSFQSDDRTYGHIIDPRTGRPVSNALLTAVVHSSATETDALSTALLTVGAAGCDQIIGLRKGMRALVVSPDGLGFRVEAMGIGTRSVDGM